MTLQPLDRQVLEAIRGRSGASAVELLDALDGAHLRNVVYSAATIESVARDLERDGLVSQLDDVAEYVATGQPAPVAARRWEVTDEGREALEQAT